MKVAVYGAGALGGYFGARLVAGGADVTLVARGTQLAALQTDGLHVRSPLGDLDLRLPAVANPAEVGPVDLVLRTRGQVWPGFSMSSIMGLASPCEAAQGGR